VWLFTSLPASPVTDNNNGKTMATTMTREQLTALKKRVVRLVIAFVIATKHHLRAEGGEPLRGGRHVDRYCREPSFVVDADAVALEQECITMI
jgi:hypothetical protein